MNMNTINIKRFGLAVGATFAILYLGCVLLVMLAGKDAVVSLFNSLFHAIDVTPLIRTEMPVLGMVAGTIETFILGWLTGATIASIYNFGANDEQASGVSSRLRLARKRSRART